MSNSTTPSTFYTPIYVANSQPGQSSGPPTGTLPNDIKLKLNKLDELVTNVLVSRAELFRRYLDSRRDLDDECGFPKGWVDPLMLQELYDREAIATRVVEVLPKETWQVQPQVYESKNSQEKTEFEKAWDLVGQGLRGEESHYQDEEGSPIWEYLERADILSGIGQFGIILLGVDDGEDDDGEPTALSQPIKGVEEVYSVPSTQEQIENEDGSLATNSDGEPIMGWTNPCAEQLPGVYRLKVNQQQIKGRKLKYLRVFQESLVQITQFENNWTSPRYGHPKMYSVSFNSPAEQRSGVGLPMTTMEVHWTRVIHIKDGISPSEVFGVERMRPVLNNLLGLRKLYGSSPEMYYRGAFFGISFETHPEMGGEVDVDLQATKDMYEEYINGLDRGLYTTGMTAKTLAPQVVDPTAQINVQIEAICILLGIPIRIFKGSERGELASSQDDAAWNDRIKKRQTGYVTPKIIIPLVDRLILIGVLPRPVGYSVWWPDLTSQSDAERASFGTAFTQALATYVSGGVENVYGLMDYLTYAWKMPEDEAAEVIENLARAMESGEGSETGGSPLLGLVGGITGMLELFQKFKDGALSEESLKQLIMLFYKVDEAKADEIIADGLPEVEEPPPMLPPPGPNGKPGVPQIGQVQDAEIVEEEDVEEEEEEATENRRDDYTEVTEEMLV